MRKIILGTVVFCLFFSFASAEVKVGDNFKEEYESYLDKLPIPVTFTNNEGFQEVPAFHLPPISSVTLDIKGEQSYTSGDTMKLNGTLEYTYQGDEMLASVTKACTEATKDASKCKNDPFYQLPSLNNTNVFVQVWRKHEGNKKGDYLIDEFYALNDTNIKDGENKVFKVNYNIPKGIVSGSYYLAFFVNTNQKFDILGLPLVTFNEGFKFNFQVESDNKGIYLDKDNIKLNNTDYAYRRPSPTIAGESIDVTLPLINNTDTERKVNITYDLYKWGQTDKNDIIDTKSEEKTVPANSTENLTHTFTPNNTDSVYNVKVTASTIDTNSTSNIRFVLKGKNRGIFRYLGLLKDGNDYFPYFCLRNAQWDGVFKGKVKITTYNKQNKVLGTHEEQARIETRDKCFTARNDKTNIKSDHVKIQGEIFNETGNLVDKAEITYDISKKEAIIPQVEDITSSKATILLITAIVILLSGGILILTINKKRDVK